MEGDKSDNINGIRGAALKSIKKYIPQITSDEEFSIKKLFEFVNNTDSKYKLIETIKNNVFLVKRNYLLMQLFSVDISNHIKLRVQESINRKVPTLIKYKFSTMFMQDKLWSQIPDMNSWITEFVRLDRFSKRDKNGSK